MNKLFNPFEHYSEKALITLGIVLLSLGSLAAWCFSGRFDGVIDFHLVEDVAIWQPFADNAIASFSLVLPLFILAKTINKRTRLVDIITTSLIARTPFIFEPLFNIGGHLNDSTEKMVAQQVTRDTGVTVVAVPETQDLIIIILFALVSIVLLVRFATLLYNGFKTATNLRKTAHIIFFILTVIIAEVLSKIIFSILFS
jgi:hypothetical protein